MLWIAAALTPSPRRGTMSALEKENPRKPLAKAKPKLRQNVLREKLKKQRQALANDVIALESNIVTKAARELDDQRAASEMAQGPVEVRRGRGHVFC